jgi:hypothetical protein
MGQPWQDSYDMAVGIGNQDKTTNRHRTVRKVQSGQVGLKGQPSKTNCFINIFAKQFFTNIFATIFAMRNVPLTKITRIYA